MVIFFSLFAYAFYIASSALESTHTLIKKLRKIIPFAVVPQIFMLSYAIYLRISQYDITINRYLVLVFGLWLGVISLYYIFSTKKYLHVAFSTLTIFSLIISVGPWSVYNLPQERQKTRLVENLKTANIYQNGEIVIPKNNNISVELSENISSGIHYLCDFDNCREIKNIFPQLTTEIQKEWEQEKAQEIQSANTEYSDDQEKREKVIEEINNRYAHQESNTWAFRSRLTKKLNIHVSHWERRNKSLYIGQQESFDIAGYTKLIPIGHSTKEGQYAGFDKKNLNIFYYNDTQGERIFLDISAIIEELESYEDGKQTQEKMSFKIDEKHFLIIHSITFPRSDVEESNDDFDDFYLEGWLLVG